MKQLYTPWGETLDRQHPLPEYPRPQLVRDSYVNLNGPWTYTVEDGEEYTRRRTGTITVPFSPECLLSGCDFQLQSGETLWYERTFALPEGFRKDRVLLHFGAVDQSCTVRVNDVLVGGHEGGYLPFVLDVTHALTDGENRLTVAVRDVTNGGEHAYGKQKYDRGGIWYTATSGIWQTVWLESVPRNYIKQLRLTPDFDGKRLNWQIRADDPAGARLTVRMNGVCIAEDRSDAGGCGSSAIPEGYFRPWTPEDPFLYTVEAELPGGDRVESYFGMRKFSTVEYRGHKVFALNNEPYFQSGLLDQGYWSDGLYTAPSDEAVIWELETVKAMGFRMLRKHIKIEPLRWYYHCDRLGILVWQDAPSGGDPFLPLYTQYLPFVGVRVKDAPSRRLGRADEKGRARFERDLEEMIGLLCNCVSLCLWVPFNEGWGQFDANRIAEKVRKLDPTRPVDHASGWHDQGGGDVKSCHVYYRPVRLKNDGRRVLALTEFGGYSLPVPGHCAEEKEFGYRAYRDAESWMAAVEKLYREQVIPWVEKQGLSAAVYTQVSDVEEEVNGLMTFDRQVVKMDPARMAALNALLRFPT
ncbi:MAG: glycoside hydrolase family 2 [Oscillospiraceae bacterium]|nr:glycoside hydrolase family 2 [Oscillospiraceae bacterium]